MCCTVGTRGPSNVQSCTLKQVTFDPQSERTYCSDLANCPVTDLTKLRLCPTVGAADGCAANEICVAHFTVVQGATFFLNVCAPQ